MLHSILYWSKLSPASHPYAAVIHETTAETNPEHNAIEKKRTTPWHRTDGNSSLAYVFIWFYVSLGINK